jgi:hypothetical protein
MAEATPDAAETKLWAQFDVHTANGGVKLTRPPKGVTFTDGNSARQWLRQNMEQQFTLGKWNDANEAGVMHCAKKAGKVARLIADYKGMSTCNVALFNLAVAIIAMCQAEDKAAGVGPQGIIC